MRGARLDPGQRQFAMQFEKIAHQPGKKYTVVQEYRSKSTNMLLEQSTVRIMDTQKQGILNTAQVTLLQITS